MPPWRCRQGNGPSWDEGNRNIRMPDFHPEGRQKAALAGLLGMIPHTRVTKPLTATCSADPRLRGLQAWDLPSHPDRQKTCKALSSERGFFQYAVLCSSSPKHPVTAVSGYFPELLRAGSGSGASQVKATAGQRKGSEKMAPDALLPGHPLSSRKQESRLDLEEKIKGDFWSDAHPKTAPYPCLHANSGFGRGQKRLRNPCSRIF